MQAEQNDAKSVLLVLNGIIKNLACYSVLSEDFLSAPWFQLLKDERGYLGVSGTCFF